MTQSATVKRYALPYAAGTESARLSMLTDTNGRTEPDADEYPFYVLASDYDALAAQLSACQARVEEAERATMNVHHAYEVANNHIRRAVHAWRKDYDVACIIELRKLAAYVDEIDRPASALGADGGVRPQEKQE